MAIFPKYNLITGSKSNELNYALQHAMVRNGEIVATDGHVLVYAKLRVLDNVVGGRLIDTDTLKEMSAAAVSNIVCDADTITIQYKGNKKPDLVRHYAGKMVSIVASGGYKFELCSVVSGNPIYKTTIKEGKVVDEELQKGVVSTVIFPRWERVIPKFDDDVRFGSFGVSVGNLDIISKCFMQYVVSKVSNIKMKFSDNKQDDIYYPDSAIQVLPVMDYEGLDEYYERAVVMPYLLKE